MNVVIIGNHAAGLKAAEFLRINDKKCGITIISKEDTPPYSRCLLPMLICGEKKLEDILFLPKDFYEQNRIEKRLGVEALKLLPQSKEVLLSTGEKVSYDALLIATGSSPIIPALPGIKNRGVFGLRSLDDAVRIKERLPDVKEAVVVGGGLVGVKAAVALRKTGKKVTMLIGSSSILSQNLSKPEASLIQKYLESKGIEILANTNPTKITGSEEAEAVQTMDEKKIACQMVVFGKGVESEKRLAEGTDIKTEYGIVVDDRCMTSVPDVYAAGDVVQCIDSVRKEKWINAIWPHAVEEARVAAENMLGKKSTVGYRTSMNSLVIDELDIVSCGLTGLREKVSGAETIEREGPGGFERKRFVIRDNKLVGFVIMGNVANAGVLGSLVRKEINIERLKSGLLKGAYGLANIIPLIKANREKFSEAEYRNILMFA